MCGVGVSFILSSLIRGSPPSGTPVAIRSVASHHRFSEDDSLVAAIRGEVESVRGLISHAESTEYALQLALNSSSDASDDPATASSIASDPGSSHRGQPAHANASPLKAMQLRECPAGCRRHGNCDPRTGRCSCPLTHEGPACNIPTMPDLLIEAPECVSNGLGRVDYGVLSPDIFGHGSSRI